MGYFYFVPMLFLCYFMASSAASSRDIRSDQSTLLAFKAHVTDPHNVLTHNWSTSYPICSWVGISCSSRHHRVIALNLSAMGLEGTIPPHLGNLSFLVHLDISYNNFYGHTPDELAQLHRLKFINFANNKFGGSFPSWIGVLSRLQSLSLSKNNFSGLIPNSLYNLSIFRNLHTLILENNKFTGRLPENIGNWSKLSALYLGDNYLQGEIPTEMGNLQNLDSLALHTNNLTGSIPPTIFNISTITRISLSDNHFSGLLLSTIGQSLPNVEWLILAKNKLSGTVPNSITNASKLSVLDLSHNSFSGLIPNTFGNLRLLSLLNLANNYLTTESSAGGWSFLPSLTSCRMLAFLGLGSNPLRSILPPLIGNFSESLQKMFAHDCELKGSIPQEIGNLRGLILLSLFNNELDGTIPTSVGTLKTLQVLHLDANNLQGYIPSDLCRLDRLTSLVLDENKLFGHIPQCLGSLTSLRSLFLSSNTLTSSIPSSLWSLEYILYVNLSTNSLSGPLPSDIQNLKVLVELDLSKNQLSGDIPESIGGLKDLATLSLARNQFYGPIPESFGSLIGLESLDLSSNNLSGEIPKSMEALSYLKQLNVSYNRLEGRIPIKGPFKNISARSFLGNYALCGPPRLQVPPCKEDDSNGSKKATLLVLKYTLPSIISSVLITIVIIFFIRCRNRKTRIPDQEDLFSLTTWRRISYRDIQLATDGFNECNLLGTGSFGSVYKGTLYDGTIVAIKVFNLHLQRAFRSFDSECEVLRNVRHRNLIKIVSSCCNPDFKALVLEFMPNGSLEKWLYSHNYFLDILERLNIMIDVGSALEYLHHGHSSAPVIHCDLKPANILLDENMVAHVSDFGISKLLGDGEDSVTQTMTMATIGYMAPEYGSEGIISAKCDVYSYGVLLMETFTRKKPTDEMFNGEISLRNWIKDSLPHALTDVVDANLVRKEQVFSAKLDCLLSIMHLALDCCMESPDERIHVTDAAAKLKKIKVKLLDDVDATS